MLSFSSGKSRSTRSGETDGSPSSLFSPSGGGAFGELLLQAQIWIRAKANLFSAYQIAKDDVHEQILKKEMSR
jgi:hypothetical protein